MVSPPNWDHRRRPFVDDPDDVARCTSCGRWQRRRFAHAEDFGPDDREEWCVTGGCTATWAAGLAIELRARHDGDDGTCRCATCREAAGLEPHADIVLAAADRGFIGDLAGLGELGEPSR
jgi:hypothetical protein